MPASNLKILSSGYILSKSNLFDNLKTLILKDSNNNYYLKGSGDPDLQIIDIENLLSKYKFSSNINLKLIDISNFNIC